MLVPNGFSEADVLRIIDEVVAKLASPFKFGFHETDDMKQEGRIFALECLPRFDAAQGTLKNFLMNHVRNRFINMKRDKFERQHPPCSSCPFYKHAHDQCGAFSCKDECDKWEGWKKRNMTKRNLMEGYNPNSVTENSGDNSPNSQALLDGMSNQEIIDYVDKNIPMTLRADYCRMLSGVKIPKIRREKVLTKVKQLVYERFGNDDEVEAG